MKIIHAHKYYYPRAGAERYMLDLMKMQQEDGHQVVPFCMHYPKNLESTWSEYFVSELKTETGTSSPWHALKQTCRSLWSLEAKRKFEALVDVIDPDVVHVHNIYTHISPSMLKVCQKRGIPVVMTVHDYAPVSANYSLWDHGRTMNLEKIGLFATARTKFIKGSYLKTLVLDVILTWQRFLKMYEKRVDKFLANSKFTAAVLVRAGFNQDKVKTLYPFTQLPTETDYKDDGYVLFFGRLEDYKGVQLLIEAMKKFPNTKLKIAGTGTYEHELRELSKGMANVEFLGFVSGQAREDLIRKARVCVVPSIWYEPFGLVAVEAMIRKTPVIVSDIGGLKEIVEPGVSGEIFRAGDSEDLVDKIRLFIQDPNYAESFSHGAHDRACEISDPQEHYANIMQEYGWLIENGEL
ncbi:glycosyltransferase [Candidatus Uhrbacteria bacterium]|jgi:glycosyltransferase involved in cell wall biosynthesis|nr:glycosyltransferase [Candidatus Uhrbacteria bacterium]MBT7717561.1 glycosyltransferase [Candidatus Uhrbacteria bacterium]